MTRPPWPRAPRFSEHPRARKSLGQNFLVDKGIQARIVEALDPGPGDEVLEIGPGTGALTQHLIGRVGRLIAVELDRDLAAALQSRHADDPRVSIVQGDILEHPLTALTPRVESLKVIGNIPYNVTTPILFHVLEAPRPARIVLMVQEEVADRIAAPPGGKEYGALAVGVRMVAQVERVMRVPRGAFRPVPGVDSAVLRITPLDPSPLLPEEELPFRTLVRAAFQWRRKQLGTILRQHADLGLDAEAGAAAMALLRIDPRRRPETLEPEEFLALMRELARSR
jgi:16S rRNA (adenine1518-N6/adenine1519-N6)-dimethyltransferase